MAFAFTLAPAALRTAHGILHGGGNARHPLMPQGFSSHYPGSARRSACSDVSAVSIITFCLRLRERSFFWRFVLEVRSAAADVSSLGGRHQPGVSFRRASSFSCRRRGSFIERVFPPDIQHPIPCPLLPRHHRQHSHALQSSPDCRTSPIRLFFHFFRIRGHGNFRGISH